MRSREEIEELARNPIRVAPFMFRGMTAEDHRALLAAENAIYMRRALNHRCEDYRDLVELLAVRDNHWPEDRAAVREYIDEMVGHWFATEVTEPIYRGVATLDLEHWQNLQALYRAYLKLEG